MSISTQNPHQAIANGEFLPYFQPLAVLSTGQLAGFEVLARWRQPDGQLVQPDSFIPQAERDGWIGELTQEILRTAFASLQEIPEPLTLSVNVSPIQLHDLSLPGQIFAAATATDFPLDRLIIEITESALIDNLERARTIAFALKEMGCRIALDDFGTGYSSLLHLQSLPFDELKIDRSFIASMTTRRESRKIVAAIVGLGQSLGLTTVGEGVETREQAEILLGMGCERGQGWLFGRPGAADAVPGFVAAHRRTQSAGLSIFSSAIQSERLDAHPFQRLAQLQAVYDGAPVGLAFLDCDLRFVNLNRRLADMNGISVADHLGKTVAEVFPEIYPQIEQPLEQALKGIATSDLEVVRRSSSDESEQIRYVSYQPALDEVGEVVGISVAAVDITESRQMQAALLGLEARGMEESRPETEAIQRAVPVLRRGRIPQSC
jgi:PAS domain S-box-containing protein